MKKYWWKEAVVYQVYPRSFQDSNGDGIGDLNGISQRLQYIKDLGADVIWLNPIYASPNDDMGYDISDYQAIMADFGDMRDFDSLLEKAHHIGLKIVMDLVVNHSSDEHHWFVESRSSRQNPYRDYYIWRDPVDGHEPNDWHSMFAGKAWTFDETTRQYYLHLFSKKQPDLNWKNPKVRNEVYDMMSWWLDKGVDGFRMDVINCIDKPDNLEVNGMPLPHNGKRVHEYLQEMNRCVLSKYDIMTVGEMSHTDPEEAIRYTADQRHELNMIFQFEHMDVDQDAALGKWRPQKWALSELKQIMSHWQVQLDQKGWNSLYWNNHDQPRVVSRFGSDDPQFRALSAKMLGAVLHFQQGTPYIYQGEELGMTNAHNFTSLEDYRDLETIGAYRELVTERHVLTPKEMMKGIAHSSRDHARTPMQWSDESNAGFCAAGVTPWIGLNANYQTINVAQQLQDKDSVYHFYQEMNALRKKLPIIVYGDYVLIDPEDEEVWTYLRNYENAQIKVIANFTDREVIRDSGEIGNYRKLLGNYADDTGKVLRPYEVKVLYQDSNKA
ncbi:glycoside hydrolase family 13 protein [Lacticaseibacillus manihotivorans]|uniref:Trehalose-6-phosphate hydrolase n=1 Tax=Lacticaseibacillus manihotivorans DSM 13343 = JCM 12514 TaxID=1423769 RepID=A0A0R1QI30_9LACO|nr:alpha-glucosidase [Lacticaseibacillus manihotivorans]KRL44284.1 trehalose-6-phosphate hydrolase [Lacticaseibacillus manihotivorans DSM 13343 = JCM 12514]